MEHQLRTNEDIGRVDIAGAEDVAGEGVRRGDLRAAIDERAQPDRVVGGRIVHQSKRHNRCEAKPRVGIGNRVADAHPGPACGDRQPGAIGLGAHLAVVRELDTVHREGERRRTPDPEPGPRTGAARQRVACELDPHVLQRVVTGESPDFQPEPPSRHAPSAEPRLIARRSPE